MRTIVLGGTNFIGRTIVENLSDAGHELLIVHRGEHEPDGLPPAEHLHVDRAEIESVSGKLKEFNGDAVIDCLAMNKTSAQKVLDAFPVGTKFVVLSSIDVYEAFGNLMKGTDDQPVPITEKSPIRAQRYPYKEMGMPEYDKLDVEELFLAQSGCILRLPMVYGPYDYQRREEFILRRVRAGRKKIPTGSGTWLSARGFVRDIAEGVRLAVESSSAAGEIFNLCEPQAWTERVWASKIIEAAGSDAELVRVPDDALPPDLQSLGVMAQHLLASSQKAVDTLGWTFTDPVEAVKVSVDWHLANPPEELNTDFSADDEALAKRVRT